MRRPLRGRDAEHAKLRAYCAALAEGRDVPVLLIEGDAGMGKSRLLAELSALGDATGVGAFVGVCDPIAHDRPFGPLFEALSIERSSLDIRRRTIAARALALATSGASEFGPTIGGLELGGRYGVQDEVVDLLLEESDTRSVLLAIDDAQWIDLATASTLGALFRRRGHRPIGVVVAMRPHPRPAAIEAMLHQWHENLDVVRLGPLDLAVACEVAGDVLGRTPPMSLTGELGRAGGNAFGVVALARAFDGGGQPEGVRASVLSRVHRLGDSAAHLLGIAAVLGADFTPEVLAVIGEKSTYEVFDLLTRATGDGLLVSRGSAFSFSHGLIAEQLRSDVPEPLRDAIHRLIVRRSKDLGLHAAVVAHHVMSASMPDDVEAIDALCRAAGEIARNDPDRALVYLDHAESLCEGGTERRSEVALRRSAVLCTLKRVGEALAALDEALLTEQDPHRIAQIRAGRARCAHLLGDLAHAADDLEQLAQSGLLAPAVEAAAWADVATYRFWLLQGHEPWAEADRAIALADSCGAVAPAVQAIAVQATMAAFGGDVARGVELAARASARGLLLPHDQVIPSPGFTEGIARLLADDLAGSISVLQRDRARSEGLGDPLLALRPATALVLARYLAGEWDDALAEANSVMEVCLETGSAVGRLVAPVVVGLIAHHRGDDVIADRSLAEANSMTGAGEAYGVPFLLHLQALRHVSCGQRELALKVLTDTVTVARSVAPAIAVWFAVDATRLIIDGVAATPGVVAGLIDGLEETAARVGLPGGLAFASIVVGAVHNDLPKVHGALEAARRSPHLLTRATALELAGAVTYLSGATEAGRALLNDAVSAYDALGAASSALRASNVGLPVTGRARLPRPERPRFGWDALTPTELAVLAMVSAAKRNGEIAEHFVLSKRTVESHVSSLLLKLGLRSRVELVVEANRRGSGPG